MNETFAAALGAIEVFRGLGPNQLAAIAHLGERIVFRPGETVIAAGQPGDGAILLVAGNAAVTGPDGEPMQPVPEGSLVGEMAMLIEHSYRITVVARSSVRALKINRGAMQALMLEDPSIAQHFTHRIASRLTRMAVELRRIDQMLALASETAAPVQRALAAETGSMPAQAPSGAPI